MMTFEDLNNFDWNNISEQRLKQESNEWFDKLISTDPVESSTSTTTAASPLEFSSLFDLGERAGETESLFPSSTTSLDNTPLLKAEDFSTALAPVPQLDLQMESAPLSRNSSISSLASMEGNDNADGSKPVPKPKKKRAPRKRLTAHQKQAHNKIEKRYRININAKIAGLQQIIPWLSAEKTAFEIGDGSKPEAEAMNEPRLNKSMILEKATGYILHLQENEKKMNEEVEKLRAQVKSLGGSL